MSLVFPLTPGTTRTIPPSIGYPGLFAIAISETLEIVALGEGAEEVVREAVSLLGERKAA